MTIPSNDALTYLQRYARLTGLTLAGWRDAMGYGDRSTFTRKLNGTRRWTPQDVVQFHNVLTQHGITGCSLSHLCRLAAAANTPGGHHGRDDNEGNNSAK